MVAVMQNMLLGLNAVKTESTLVRHLRNGRTIAKV